MYCGCAPMLKLVINQAELCYATAFVANHRGALWFSESVSCQPHSTPLQIESDMAVLIVVAVCMILQIIIIAHSQQNHLRPKGFDLE